MTKSNTFDWLCVQIPLFSEGFRLPYLMTLRKIAPDVSHHLQVFYSACCYPLIIKYLSHFPRLSILEIHSRSVSIPSDSVRQFGCLLCFQKDYLHNLHESLLFRHTFRKGYFCIKIKFDTAMYGTFGASMVSATRSKNILKNICLISISHDNFAVNINRLYYHITVYPFISKCKK